MNLGQKQIEARLAEIKAAAEEDAGYDQAHNLEDKLHLDFIAFVAAFSTDTEVAAMAHLVLTSRQIPFPRHTA